MNTKILLADDAPFMRMIQKAALEKNGFEVCGEAEDGFDVIEKYEDLEPDVLILGLMLKKIDSMEVLKKIKSSYPEARIIICSSMAREKHIADAMRYGACDFIVKPFDPGVLAASANTALQNTKLSVPLDANTVVDWYVGQRNHNPDENLSQEQASKIVASYYLLYR